MFIWCVFIWCLFGVCNFIIDEFWIHHHNVYIVCLSRSTTTKNNCGNLFSFIVSEHFYTIITDSILVLFQNAFSFSLSVFPMFSTFTMHVYLFWSETLLITFGILSIISEMIISIFFFHSFRLACYRNSS